MFGLNKLNIIYNNLICYAYKIKVNKISLWFAYIGRATTHKPLTSAIPLLPPADTLSC